MKPQLIKMSVPQEIMKAVQLPQECGTPKVKVDHLPHILQADVLLKKLRLQSNK